MKSSSLIVTPKKNAAEKVKCLLLFLTVISPYLLTAMLIRSVTLLCSQVLLFFTGWLTWTFIEYFNHRFRMHGDGNKEKVSGYSTHLNHHHHPTDIRITQVMKVLSLTVNIGIIIWCVISWQGWLTVFAGIFSGFVLYSFMHALLHQRVSARLFPRLQNFHIHHHCKYPNSCFGVSVIWWDVIFHTSPPKDAYISPKVLRFYFND
ncbi:MAG: sterol desaturase family protein [Chitinophagaceae bacterium]